MCLVLVGSERCTFLELHAHFLSQLARKAGDAEAPANIYRTAVQSLGHNYELSIAVGLIS